MQGHVWAARGKGWAPGRLGAVLLLGRTGWLAWALAVPRVAADPAPPLLPMFQAAATTPTRRTRMARARPRRRRPTRRAPPPPPRPSSTERLSREHTTPRSTAFCGSLGGWRGARCAASRKHIFFRPNPNNVSSQARLTLHFLLPTFCPVPPVFPVLDAFPIVFLSTPFLPRLS